jgi:anti-sigma-K factor RskA
LTNGEHIRDEEFLLLAAGALPEEECAAQCAHAAGCAECAAKLAEARGQAALLALLAPQERPAATIKAELFARIRAEREADHRYRWPTKSEKEVSAPKTDGGFGRGSAAPARRARWEWILVPVAAALLVAAVVQWRENQRLSTELGNANRQIVDLMNERQRTQMLVDVLSAGDTVSVKLASTPEMEKAWGMVQYNAGKGMVLYSAVLPPLPQGKTYQLWLVPKSGAPISAGVFLPTHGARQLWTAEVPLNTEVKAFAVTIEPAGGMPQPTGPKVLLGAS